MEVLKYKWYKDWKDPRMEGNDGRIGGSKDEIK